MRLPAHGWNAFLKLHFKIKEFQRFGIIVDRNLLNCLKHFLISKQFDYFLFDGAECSLITETINMINFN